MLSSCRLYRLPTSTPRLLSRRSIAARPHSSSQSAPPSDRSEPQVEDPSPRTPPPTPPNRTYCFTVDHHGQLFLSSTKIRNFTSNVKEPAFLDFFYQRLRPNDGEVSLGHDAGRLRDEGYSFVSPCGPERNYVRPDITPLVFQKLTDEGLTYAGTGIMPFEPSSLLMDQSTGYVFHPSPRRKSRRKGVAAVDLPAQYGAHSLVRSEIVREHFAQSLEYGSEGEATFVWKGKEYVIRAV